MRRVARDVIGMQNRTRLSMRSDHATAVELKLDKTFQPCPAELGDELYPNGIFEFNITRILAFVATHADRFPIERVEVDDIPNYGSENLDEEAIGTADLFRPILLAEISPGLFSLIDGHHRIAKARREGVKTLPAHRVACPHHVRFLTSTRAYKRYVEYWNEKLALSERR
jgi:hypothetical protein